MDSRNHGYRVSLTWTGNTGAGTRDRRAYRRTHDVAAAGKPAIAGSSDPAFRGDRDRWNPEELLVVSLAPSATCSGISISPRATGSSSPATWTTRAAR
jgi:organic hydroperoxide reductase OsmC/OhrA